VTPPRSLTSKAIRFGLVGIANSLVDLAVFAVVLAAGAAPLLANLVGWGVAVVFSYFLNSRWSFERSTRVGELRAAARFIGLGALITLGVSSGAILALTDFVGVMPAKIIGLAVAAVLNFIAARWSIEDRIV
jgi:putative flippase GtrA